MKKNLLFYKRGTLLAAVAALLALGSCVHEEPPGGGKESVAEDAVRLRVETVPAGTRTAPARTVYNPYLLDNVRTSAAAAGMTRAEDIQPTHYYVRFRPATDDLANLVECDPSLECFSYPLDVDIPEGAMCYIDYEQPAESPQFIFALVPVGYFFPAGVDYDILAEINVDHEFGDSDGGGDDAGGNRGIFLIAENFETGERGIFDDRNVNINDGFNPPGGGDTGGSGGGGGGSSGGGSTGGGNSQRHRGRIRVWDDALQDYVPLQGVRVVVKKNVFNYMSRITDANGEFNFTLIYNKGFQYIVHWHTSQYKIMDGSIFSNAQYAGPKDDVYVFNLDIGGPGDTGKQQRFATVHRAAWRCYFGNTGGMGNIPYQTNPAPILVHDDTGRDKFLPVMNRINLYTKSSSTTYYNTRQIFSHTAHELGHLQHYRIMDQIFFKNFFDLNYTIVESWGEFVEWWITLLEYQERGLPAATLTDWREGHNPIGKQAWPYDGILSSNFTSYQPVVHL